ncbi:crt, partial [Symbiodinium necroappetens]
MQCSATRATPKVYFHEKFLNESWESRWVHSEQTGSVASFEWSAGQWFANESEQRGLRTAAALQHHAISAKLSQNFSNRGRDLVLQFTVKHENEDLSFCGGGYIKLMGSDLHQKSFGPDSPYKIMFGPDICGFETSVVHLVLNWKGKNLRRSPEISLGYDDRDSFTHIFTFHLKPDNTYSVFIDMKEKSSGELHAFWPFPNKTIDDPTDRKPEDWVETRRIVDPDVQKPESWVDEQRVPDSTAWKPLEWDDEEDGLFEPPFIDNPLYQGPWFPAMVDNPSFRGQWRPRQRGNPEYEEEVYSYTDLGAVGFDLWTVHEGSVFDNILLCDSLDFAKSEATRLQELFSKEKEARRKWKQLAGDQEVPANDAELPEAGVWGMENVRRDLEPLSSWENKLVNDALRDPQPAAFTNLLHRSETVWPCALQASSTGGATKTFISSFADRTIGVETVRKLKCSACQERQKREREEKRAAEEARRREDEERTQPSSEIDSGAAGRERAEEKRRERASKPRLMMHVQWALGLSHECNSNTQRSARLKRGKPKSARPRRQTDVQGAAVEVLLEVTAGDDPEREEVARLAVPGTIGAREESQPRTARAAQLVAMLVEGIRKAVPTRTIGAGPMQMNLEEMPGEMPPLNARSRGDPPAPRARAVTEKTQAHGDLHARARAVRSGRSQEPLQAERAVAAVAAMMMQAAGADRLEGAARTPTAGDATTLREGRGRSARRMLDFAVLILAERRSPLTKALAELHLARKHVRPRERLHTLCALMRSDMVCYSHKRISSDSLRSAAGLEVQRARAPSLTPPPAAAVALSLMAGVIAQLPGGTSHFVPVEPSLLGGPLETAELLRHFLDAELFARRSATSSDDDEEGLVSAFGRLDLEESIEVEEYRVLYQGRDLECEKTAAQFLESLEDGRPCFVRIAFRLLGGKGGFGSLLRSQKGGKKTTNFDAMRDLNGRRVRHVKAVERIKEWLEKKKR